MVKYLSSVAIKIASFEDIILQVLILTDNKEEGLVEALNSNLKSAALCGLLLTAEHQCSEEELYCSIAGLSYGGLYFTMLLKSVNTIFFQLGDFRMHVGEE